ncbi:hypothetical protein ACJO17_13110 [Vibrio parahaemolyticus]|uniref:hypothetical protein n=1 Tax=Vibrio parahaemolyticus TaxID=670 RepID=UPI001B835CDA|nr:hypothetical protein [Vibrio parahaemolyticus]HBC3413369.1 hypothetical protein [Vibrio parahaemolyticus]HBC3601343.1 hypothetical protein [Vibrio parahaemolyticus]HBC3876730.1 hypothetical protein [Vibrio parahaemolyticus]HBC3932635.1 hypothetical protein [Vibrio parahaemolyticus]
MKNNYVLFGQLVLSLLFVIFPDVSYAQTFNCVNTSGNQRTRVQLNTITLTQAQNVPNSIIYDQPYSTPLLTAECDCAENTWVAQTFFTGGTNPYATYVDNYDGSQWYTVPGSNVLAYALDTDIWNDSIGAYVKKDIPFTAYGNNVPESNCKGPSTLSSLTQGRLRIRLLNNIIGVEDINNSPIGYFRMRRGKSPDLSADLIRMVEINGQVFSGHNCFTTGAFTQKYTFKTSFLSDFDDQKISENTQIPPQTHITNIYCNYSNVPVEIEFTGDFSDYGLKTDLDGVEIKSVLSVGTFGTNYVINNVWNKFNTSLDSKGYKRIQFTSAPVLTKPKSQVTLGKYSATMRIRVNFK